MLISRILTVYVIMQRSEHYYIRIVMHSRPCYCRLVSRTLVV